MPVTTTRLILSSPPFPAQLRLAQAKPAFRGLNKPDADVLHVIDPSAVALQPPVGDAEDQLALEYALDIHAVDDLLTVGRT